MPFGLLPPSTLGRNKIKRLENLLGRYLARMSHLDTNLPDTGWSDCNGVFPISSVQFRVILSFSFAGDDLAMPPRM